MSIEVAENRFVTYTDWSGYLKYLDAVGDGRTRVTYDRGTLELLSPSNEHEQVKSLLGSFVESILVEDSVDFQFGGSTTFKREDLDRGLEPDECYWIAHWRSFLGRPYQSDSDPPPDLVVEVDITSSSINRIELYRAMQVPTSNSKRRCSLPKWSPKRPAPAQNRWINLSVQPRNRW